MIEILNSKILELALITVIVNYFLTHLKLLIPQIIINF